MPFTPPRRPLTTTAEWDRWARGALVELHKASVEADAIVDGAITPTKIAVAPVNGQFVVRRGAVMTNDTIQLTDLPAGAATDAEVTAAIAAHVAAGDPHPVYLTAAEGNAAYQPLAAVLSMLHTGTGSPESVVTATVGHLYLRSDGGANTTLYVKESGAGSSGWVAK